MPGRAPAPKPEPQAPRGPDRAASIAPLASAAPSPYILITVAALIAIILMLVLALMKANSQKTPRRPRASSPATATNALSTLRPRAASMTALDRYLEEQRPTHLKQLFELLRSRASPPRPNTTGTSRGAECRSTLRSAGVETGVHPTEGTSSSGAGTTRPVSRPPRWSLRRAAGRAARPLAGFPLSRRSKATASSRAARPTTKARCRQCSRPRPTSRCPARSRAT